MRIPTKRNTQAGMTIVEIMTVVCVLAIAVVLAVSYLNPKRNKLRDAASALRTDILQAKSEAIKRNQSVIISSAGHQYNATVGGVVILSRDIRVQYENNFLSINTTSATISPTGTAFNANFTISDGAGNSKTVEVNRAAKVSIQ